MAISVHGAMACQETRGSAEKNFWLGVSLRACHTSRMLLCLRGCPADEALAEGRPCLSEGLQLPWDRAAISSVWAEEHQCLGLVPAGRAAAEVEKQVTRQAPGCHGVGCLRSEDEEPLRFPLGSNPFTRGASETAMTSRNGDWVGHGLNGLDTPERGTLGLPSLLTKPYPWGKMQGGIWRKWSLPGPERLRLLGGVERLHQTKTHIFPTQPIGIDQCRANTLQCGHGERKCSWVD